MRRYSDEEKAYLREIISGHSHAEIASLFNARFESPITINQVKSFLNNNKLSTGRTGYFPKGHVPHNKGKRGPEYGHLPTSFKKGNVPPKLRPIGSTRVNKDGCVEIKTDGARRWKTLHTVIWEKAHEPVPKGYVVIFGDGDKKNYDVNNLLLVSRVELAILNKFGLIGASADITRTGVLVADLKMKINERSRKEVSRDNG